MFSNGIKKGDLPEGSGCVTFLSRMRGGGSYRKNCSRGNRGVGSRSHLKVQMSSLHTKCECSVPCILRTLILDHTHTDWFMRPSLGMSKMCRSDFSAGLRLRITSPVCFTSMVPRDEKHLQL